MKKLTLTILAQVQALLFYLYNMGEENILYMTDAEEVTTVCSALNISKIQLEKLANILCGHGAAALSIYNGEISVKLTDPFYLYASVSTKNGELDPNFLDV